MAVQPLAEARVPMEGSQVLLLGTGDKDSKAFQMSSRLALPAQAQSGAWRAVTSAPAAQPTLCHRTPAHPSGGQVAPGVALAVTPMGTSHPSDSAEAQKWSL